MAKNIRKRGFCTGVTDRNGPTDRRTYEPTDKPRDRPFYRDAYVFEEEIGIPDAASVLIQGNLKGFVDKTETDTKTNF